MVKYVILIKQTFCQKFAGNLNKFQQYSYYHSTFYVVEFCIWQTHNEPEIISTYCGL